MLTTGRRRSSSTVHAASLTDTCCLAARGRRTCWCPGRAPSPCRPWRARLGCWAPGPSPGGREDQSTGWWQQVWTPGRCTRGRGRCRRLATRRTRSAPGSRRHRRPSTEEGVTEREEEVKYLRPLAQDPDPLALAVQTRL